MTRRCAFTLVEVMVSVAVTAVVLFVMMQITSHVLQTTRYSHQRINATQKARAAFDALGGDFAHLVKERGMTILTRQWIRSLNDTTAQNIAFSFLTQGRPSVSDTKPSRFVAVDYCLDKGNLIRSLSPVAWNSPDLLQEPITIASGTNASVVVRGIVRFDAIAVLDDGTTTPLFSSAVTSSTNSWFSNAVNGKPLPQGMAALMIGNASPNANTGRRVQAIVVALATLDEKNFALLADGGLALGKQLLSPANGETPVDCWNRALKSGSLNSFPHPVVATLQFSQRTYELK